tara:strand:+ start:230 stop:802 length:573 start_codon:yes stop_codon:yes gene_type:complete
MALSRVGNAYTHQVSNRNFLNTVGFRFTLNRARKVSFFANQANIPGLNLGLAEQPSYLKNIDIPGDKIQFNDFTLRFIVDENLENYMQIHKWMRGLGFPESLKEIFDLQKDGDQTMGYDSQSMNIYSDGTLQVMNSSNRVQFEVIFDDMFPYDLSDLTFDATSEDTEYFTAEVSFKYTIYNITDAKGDPL